MGDVAGSKTVSLGVGKTLPAEPVQVALAWLLHQPGVSSVITGATRVSQVEENVAAADIELNEELLARIDEVVA